MRQPMNRRYWGNFQIDAVALSRVESEDSATAG
jgi:flagellar motor switch protein FliM